jgi:hypothetical protein
MQVQCRTSTNQFCSLTGSRFGEAFQEPASFIAIKPLFEVPSYLLHSVCFPSFGVNKDRSVKLQCGLVAG